MPRKPTGRPRGRPRSDELSKAQAAIVILVIQHGATQQEIADATGLSRSTVRNHWERACERVGRKLGYDALRAFTSKQADVPPEILSLDTRENTAAYVKMILA